MMEELGAPPLAARRIRSLLNGTKVSAIFTVVYFVQAVVVLVAS